MIRPGMLAGGHVVGTWRPHQGAPVLEPLEPLSAEVAAAFDAEVARVVAFLEGGRGRTRQDRR